MWSNLRILHNEHVLRTPLYTIRAAGWLHHVIFGQGLLRRYLRSSGRGTNNRSGLWLWTRRWRLPSYLSLAPDYTTAAACAATLAAATHAAIAAVAAVSVTTATADFAAGASEAGLDV